MRALLTCICLGLAPIIACAQQGQAELRSDPGSDYFLRARQLYDAAQHETDPLQQKELYERAIPILDDYIRLYPRHKHAQAAHYYQAESYYALGMKRNAGLLYDQIIHKFRKGHYVAAAAYRLAFENYNAQRYKQAARLFGVTATNAEKAEDKIRSTYYRAQCYLQLNDTKRALPLLEQVAKSPIDSPYKKQAEISSAHILLNSKKYAEALKIYEELIPFAEKNPQFKTETFYHAGVAAAGLKKSDVAEKYFDSAIQESSDSPWKSSAHIALLKLYYQDKNYDSIINLLGKSQVKLSPKQLAQQGVIVGQSYFQKKNYADAINFFLDVERSVPNTDMAFEAAYYKLLSLFNLDTENDIPKMVDQFIENYAANRGTSKYIHQAILIKAEVLYEDKLYKEAAEAYSAVNTKYIDKRNLPSLLYKKGWSLAEIGNHEGAVSSFSEYLKLEPKGDQANVAYAKRGQSYMKLNNRVKALKDFDIVIKNAPKSQIAAMSLQHSARVQRDAKQYEDVAVRLEQLLKDFPKLSEGAKANSHYWLGNAYFKTDKFKYAIPHLETARQMDKEAYGRQTSMLLILARYSMKDVDGLKTALADAEKADLKKQIPLPVYRWLGNQCYNAGDFKEAAKYFTKGCEDGVPQKTPIIVWKLLGKAQLQNEQFTNAAIAFDNVLEMEKEPVKRVEAMLDKCKALIGLKRYEEALKTGKEALALNPSGSLKVGLLLAIGDVAYLMADYNAAAEHYVVVAVSFGDDQAHPEGLFKLAKALEKSGKAKDANQYKAQLKKEYPDYKAPKGF